jgi:hypothetical protein
MFISKLSWLFNVFLYHLIMLNYKPFYRHKILDNQGIKLIQENHNLNRIVFCQLNWSSISQLVGCFNLFHSVVLSHPVDVFPIGQLVQLISINQFTSNKKYKKDWYINGESKEINQSIQWIKQVHVDISSHMCTQSSYRLTLLLSFFFLSFFLSLYIQILKRWG